SGLCPLSRRPIAAFPTPSGGHWFSIGLGNGYARAASLARVGRRLPSAPGKAIGAGATLMKVDLQQVDTEIAALQSRLAAINDNLDECRLGYFEHPWAWSQMRRMLTAEWHHVQRRLDEFTFARECIGGRQLRSVAAPSFRSLASPDERNVDLERLTFRLIQG